MSNSKTTETFWVILGAFAINVFSLIISAVLSRYMLKEDYGTYRQVFFIYNTLVMVFTAGLPAAYLYFIPRISKKEAKNLVNRINILLLILGILLSCFIYFGSSLISFLLNNPNLEAPLRLFSVVPFLLLPTIGVENIFIAMSRAKVVGIYNFLSRLALLVLILSAVFLVGNEISTILWAWIFSASLTFLLAYVLKRWLFKKYTSEPSKIKNKEIFAYGYPLMLTSLVSIGVLSADQYFISSFGPEIFAEFSNGFMQLPLAGIVMSSIASVMTVTYSELFSKEKIDKKKFEELWLTATSKAILLIYPLVIFFMIFAKETILILFGDQYESSAFYFQMMLMVNFINITTVIPVILSLGEVKFNFKLNLLVLIMIWPIEYLALIQFNSPYAIAFVSVIFNIFKTVACLYFIAQKIDININRLIPYQHILKVGIVSIVATGTAFLSGTMIIDFISNQVIFLGICGLVFLIILLLIAPFFKLDYYSIIKPLVNKFLPNNS